MAGPDLTYTPGPDLTYTPDVEAPKKEPRSAIAEIANQGYAGVVADLPEMVGKTAQYATNPGDLIYGWGKGVADAAKARGAQPDLQPDPANHNIVTNTLASGARMIPQSIVPAAVVGGAVAGAGVAGPGALLIGSALGSLPAAMSQGQTTLDKAEEAGVGRDIAIPAARKTALIEGAGETLGTFAGAKLLGLGGKALSTTLARATGKAEGSAAGHVLADATDASVLKPWLKQIPETLATEVGTEMGQNAGEAYVEQQAGIDKQTPWDAAKEAIGPTVGMTALLAPFGLAGFGIRAKQNARRAEALTSAETAPGERLKAAFEIKTQLDEINPEAGKNFGEHVLQAIEDQTPLEIGEHLFAPPTGVARDAASDTANQEAGAAVDDQINMVGEPTVPTPEGFVREEPSNTIIPPAPQQVAAVPADNAQGATVIDRNTGPLSAAVVDLGITPNDAQTLGGLFKAHYSKLDAETALAALPDPERYRITQHPNSTVPGALAVIPKPANVLADMDLKAATQQANEARTQQVEQEDGNAAPAPIKPAPGVPTPPPTATQAMAGDLALANEAAQSELQAPVAQPVAEMPGPAKMSAKMTEAARLAAIQRNATVQAEEALPGALAPTQPTEKANVPKANQTKQAKPATQTEEDAAQSEIAQSTGKLSLPRSPRLPGETNEAYQARRAAELNARKAATPTSVPPTQERDTQAARTALGKEATGEEQVVLTKDLPDQRNAPKGHVSRQAAEFIGHVSKLFGKRVVFVKGMKPDGMRTAGNTIYLSTNSSVAHLRVAGHEMVHAMKAQHRKAYNHMRDALKSVLTDAELIKQHKDYAGKELDPADLDDAMRDFLTEEWLADLGGNRFAEAGFWQDVFTQVEAKHGTEAAKGIIAKLRLAIVNALQKLLKIVNGNAFAVDARMAENLDQIRKAVAEGFVQYAQAVKNGQLETETEGVKFSRRTNDFTRGEDRTEVSTTVPTAKTRGTVTDDAVDQKWIIDARDILDSDSHLAAAEAAIRTYNSVGFEGKSSALKALHDTVVDNLTWLHNLMPKEIRARAKLWYDGANRMANDLSAKYGIDKRQAAGVYAVLSPQKDWFMNVSLADRIIAIVKRHGNEPWTPAMTAWVKSYVAASKSMGERTKRAALLPVAQRLEGKTLNSIADLKDAAKFVRIFDETYFPRSYRTVTPEGGYGDYVTNGTSEVDEDADSDIPEGSVAWGGYGTIEKALAILRDNNRQTMFRTISGALGGEHKVRNFYNNIVSPNSADGHVTIDTHAVAAALFKALSGTSLEVGHNFGTTPKGFPGAGGNAQSGASGLYGVFADAYRDAAAELGILPRELQSITWEAIRAIFLPAFKTKHAGDVNAIFNRHLAGEISREEARKQAYKLAGGKIRTLPWEGTPAGKTIQDGGMSFDDQIDADPAKRTARTMEAEEMQVSVSASTNAIPFIRKLYKAAQKGNEFAQAQLQWLASAGLKEALKGTSARVKFDLATGLYGGYAEPSLAAVVSFKPEDRQIVLEALKQFADNYKQEQVHVRQSTDAALGVKFQDGSYSTPTYRWDLSRALSKQEIQDVIDKSGLYGLTFGDDFVEAYYVGDVTNELARNDFDTAIQSADRLLGAANQGIKQFVTRLWAYGDRGDGAIGWPSDSVSAPGQEATKLSPQRGRPDDLGDRSGSTAGERPAPRYGRGIDGAVSATGYHFSKQPRTTLDGTLYGTGLKGLEAQRLAGTENADIRPRVFFYVDTGSGVRAEDGVGGNGHRVQLDNLYDVIKDAKGIVKRNPGANNWERAVKDAGFDGYLIAEPRAAQGFAVLIGAKHNAVPVQPYSPTGYSAPTAAPEPYKRGLTSKELNTIDLAALQAVAPSAKLRMGNLTMDAGDVAAARAELAKQGIELPETKFSEKRNDLFPEEFATKETVGDSGVKITSKGATRKGANVNSDGQQITATKQGVDNFWKWFGDSAAVDGKGRPLVLYHSTNADFDTFQPGRETVNSTTFGDVDTQRHGIFTSPDKKFSQEYLRKGEGQNVMPVYASINTPLDLREGINGDDLNAIIAAHGDDGKLTHRDFNYVDPYETWTFFDGDFGERFVAAAKAAGFDGAIMLEAGPDGNKPATTYVAFNPTQLKSATGNSGAFDGTNPDIRYSKKRIVGSTEDYTPAMLATMSKLGWQVEVPTLKERAQALWKDAGKKLAQGIADQFAPVKDLDGKAYGLLRLAKGASGAFEALLKGGKLKLTDNVYDIDTAERGGVVDKLLLPLQGEHHNFFRWVAAQRAEQLKQVGKENLFDQSDIDTINDWTNTTPAKFDYVIQHGVRRGQTTRNRAEMFRDSNVTFNAFNKNVLDLAEQSGLIDGSTRHIWENEFYVPFYRVADEADGGVRGMNIKGSVVRQKAFERLKGGKQKLNADLLDNTLMNWAHLLDASAKNRAAKATIDAAEAMGIAMGGNQTALAQMGNTVGNKNGVVWFMDQGQKRYSLIDNQGDGQYLMTALTSLEYAGMRNPAMQAMGAMKHALTVGVTASPFFKVRNLIRDSVQVIGTGPISYNVGKNLAEGWKLTDPKSDAYFRLLAGGGTIHFGTMLEGSEAKRIQALVESGVPASTILNDPTKVKALWSKMSDAVGIYNEIGNRGEAINRAALYDQLRKQGKSHAEASLEARDLMDFSMQGAWTSVRFLTQVVPFLNARIQGLYKLGKAAKQDPARISLVLGATAMASLALLAAYGDDDDWKKRTDSDRNNFWWFKLGGVAYRIPKPFEIGAIGTLAERGFELAFDNEMTGERFRGQALALLSDQLSMNPIPQLVKPMLDVYSNIDSFSGRPIENMAQQKLKAEYRFNDRTSMAARGASTAMNAVTGVIGKETLSPVQVDHLLRGYFGWLGTMVVSAGDVLARPATDQPKQASTDWLKALTGNMASDLRDAPSRYVGQMYEQAAKNAEAYATWKLLQKEQKPAEAAAFAADHRDKLMAYRRTEAAKKSETLFNNMVRMVERNRELDPDQKREKLRAIQIQKEAVAKRAVAV